MNDRARIVSLLVLAALLCGPTYASSDKKREHEMQRRIQMQLQQAQSQLATLQQENTTLGGERDKALKDVKMAQVKLHKLSNSLGEEKAHGARLQKEMDGVKLDLAATKSRQTLTEGKLAETGKTLSQTQQTLALTEADKRRLEGVKARQEKEIASDEDKNLKLYQIGRELMTRFEQKSCAEILAQKEPFTGLKRVETENLLEEYRDKLDEQKIIKPPGG